MLKKLLLLLKLCTCLAFVYYDTCLYFGLRQVAKYFTVLYIEGLMSL